MKLLQRYILAELIRVFSLLIVVLTVMLVFVGLFREGTERGLGAMQILQIMPFVVPSLLPFTIPATLLLAVCVVYGRISGDLEVTAAKAAGISAMELLSPAFLLGGMLSLASFGMTNHAIPWAVVNIERIVTQGFEDIFLDVLATQNLYSDARGGYSITVREVRDRTLIDATFRYRLKNHQQVTLRAEAARIQFDLERQEIRLMLKNAAGSRPGSGSSAEFTLDYQELFLPLPPQIGKVKPRHLTIRDLQGGIQKSSENRQIASQQRAQFAAMLMLTGDFADLTGDRINNYSDRQVVSNADEFRYRTEIHSRFAMAASCIFFALVGGPFSMLQARRQFITSFILCFLPILLIYYPVLFLMINLCKNGTLEPWWSLWLPNAVLATAGLYVLRKVIRH